ncbi:MAG: hypothetical protein WCR55_09670 [Lentisphaerota bacterium]
MLKDDFNKLVNPGGIVNYLEVYLSNTIDTESDSFSEEKFIEKCISSKKDKIDEEDCIKNLLRLLNEALSTFSVIATGCNRDNSDSCESTIQRALHEYMFRMLYYLEVYGKKLLEANIDHKKFKDLVTYKKYLIKKYPAFDKDFDLFSNKRTDDYLAIINSIAGRSARLQIYKDDDKGVCFQLLDSELNNIFPQPSYMCIENGIIISKYFFFFQIFTSLKYFELFTRIMLLEKNNAPLPSKINTYGIHDAVMDNFINVAEEFFDLDYSM